MIVGAGYLGLEMAEGLRARGLSVTQFEQLPEVLPTVDASLGALVNATLTSQGIDVRTSTTVHRVGRAPAGSPARLQVDAVDGTGAVQTTPADLVLVVVGVRPDTGLAVSAGGMCPVATPSRSMKPISSSVTGGAGSPRTGTRRSSRSAVALSTS